MGDIISSRKYSADKLNKTFTHLVSYCNKEMASGILSPYTITLGDEFQGIAKSLRSALEAIFYFEEIRLKKLLTFNVRFVLVYGGIDTPINEKIAYGMMGPGLSKARGMLTDKKRGASRFLFDLPDSILSLQLTRIFSVLESMIEEWHKRDFPLIMDMLANENNEEVGNKYGKNRSQIWKRRKSLRISEYKILKQVIFDLIK